MLEALLAGLFGLLIGSFLNVCIYRLPRDLSVVRPRSFCPQCRHQIAAFDNIPVLTYLLLGGRCRRCRAPISWRYPLVELLTGGSFFLAVLLAGPSLAAAKLCAFSAIQIALIFTDLEHRILPDEITLGGAFAGVWFAVLTPMPLLIAPLLIRGDFTAERGSLVESLLGLTVTPALLWSIGVIYERVRHREGLGLGDVKMMAMVGAFLGLHGALLTLMLGSLAGSILGLLFIWLAGKDREYELPFGSFLGAAAIVVAFASLR